MRRVLRVGSALLIHKMMLPPYRNILAWGGFKNIDIIVETGYNSWSEVMWPARKWGVVLGTAGIEWFSGIILTEGGAPWGGSRREWVDQFSQSMGCIKESNERWGKKGPYLPLFTLLSLLRIPCSSQTENGEGSGMGSCLKKQSDSNHWCLLIGDKRKEGGHRWW